MYCYYTGVTGVLAMSLSMFTSMNIISGFGAEFPYLFTAGHVIFLFIVLGLIAKAWFHWVDFYQLTKYDFYRSLMIYIFLYIIGWLGFAYSGPIALIVGVIDVFITRKRAGLIK
ncbi:hypothetical protein [Dolosigranulum pigrum]|uniref:hypothetical protein n=1 Tax=Dolosigranulum pigrum TaxID=29394 RepID=UPI001AD858D1|nr:hypothetical protein [Dolosigranulum pigrum]QTJ36202.1 hypothetical protein FE323_04000 [Dolosigranulum pigrum]